MPKPANLTFEQAAAVADLWARRRSRLLRDDGHVQPGQKVLIIGASGGVGTFAVQIAKAFGADVTGVCSTTKVELVRSIGADARHRLHARGLPETGPRYDLILDIAGNRSLSRLRRALAPNGTLVIVGGEGGGRWLGGIDRSSGAQMRVAVRAPEAARSSPSENGADLVVLKELIEAGKVTPVIDTTYPLSEVPEAIRHVEEGHARGKVVITIELIAGRHSQLRRHFRSLARRHTRLPDYRIRPVQSILGPAALDSFGALRSGRQD